MNKIQQAKNFEENKNFMESNFSVSGLMTCGKLDNGLHTADFMCDETIQTEPFTARCKVQMMRDGNIYVTELPRRERRRPLFREDNSSLSVGKDERFYFVFTMPAKDVQRLPKELVRQASTIAGKVMNELLSTLNIKNRDHECI